jgi:hypothetical protein
LTNSPSRQGREKYFHERRDIMTKEEFYLLEFTGAE